MLARNLTAAFSEQLRAVINNTPTQQRVLEDMAAQIKNLEERIEPHPEIPKSHESQEGNSRTSHSSRRNKNRRERSKTYPHPGTTDTRDGDSKTATPDARTFLESKKRKTSESVQSLLDKRREERKKAELAGSSRPLISATMPRNEATKSVLPEEPISLVSPLAMEILNTPNPGKIKVPNMAAFDGTSCPQEHMTAYKNLMLLYTTNSSLWSSKRQEKSNFHLLSVTQLEGESISSYLKKFHEAVLEVTDLEDQVKTYAEAMKQCQSYVTASEICQAHDPKRRKSEKKEAGSSLQSSRRREEHSPRGKNYMPRRPGPPSDMGPPRARQVYVAGGETRTRNLGDGGNDPMFNRNRRDIFFAVRDQLPAPPPVTTPSDRRNYNLWCDYHKEHGHTLAQCRELKRILHQLADEGKLSRFINRRDYDAGREGERRPWQQKRRSPKRNEARRESSDTQGTINMIFGGYTEEYPTIRAAKNSVHTLLKGPPMAASKGPVMKFDATTSQPLQQPHTDPLKDEVRGEALATPRQTTDWVWRESVVDLNFPYNAIMGLPLINKIKAAIFPHQLLLQFETDNGQVGILKGDQVTARQCLVNTLKRRSSETPAKRKREDKVPAVMSVYRENPNTHERPRPIERYEEVDMFKGKQIKIGKDLPDTVKQDIVATIAEFRDVFAFCTEEMPGIPNSVACHKLDIKPGHKPVKQKLRHQGRERTEAAKEEVEKLLRAGFIKECQYSEWLSNVVLVKKPNSKWRMCVDFTDLNKACPKDDYPLPKIDRLVDSTAGHALLSFMDANAGYHQIPLATEDQPHTAFITSTGVYCYKVMPFGLKNAGATYQRMVNKVFQSQIGRNLEVYVDDMITKSKQASQHAADLRETFLTLQKHQMKLNPDKCVFGVTGGKCLGFLVDERGIEANPDKIQALQNMRSPTSVKEVQKLTGCIAALGRFLSKSADKCSPFFKTIKQQKFEWTAEAEESFRQLKEHLSTLPKLVSPIKGEKLVLYVSVSEYSLSGVLVAEREKKQFPVYYVSHAFRGSEGNYGEVEKVVFAIVMASRKLKPYFQSHQIIIRTDQPLKKILEGKNKSSRVTDWANQLADFGIEYEPRTAIKAQALADFIAESTFPCHPEPNQKWKLYVDGSSTQSASGAGLLIMSSAGVRMERAVRFEFAASNNEAEYEALLMGLRICYEAGAKNLSAFSDSQLIVGQVNGEFEAKDDSMKMYLQQVKEFVQKFDKFTLEHIPRSQNAQADSLAKLASSAETSAARDIIWEVLPNPSINFMVNTIDRSDTWMEPYIEYLRNQTLPQDKSQANTLQKKARWFELHEGTLYKKSYTHPLLKCVSPEEGNYILREIHEGGCGIHQGVRTVIGKVLRSGYYWPSLREDAEYLIKRCPECQYHSKIGRKPSNYLTAIQAVLPFDKWGMDLLGPFPPAKGQRKFIIVAIDYFTKYVEAEALSSITDKQVCQFIWRNIITRYGIPRVIITDNGRQFVSKNTIEYCDKFNIQIRFSSVSRPQTNGQVESANKEILNGIKKKIEGVKGNWDEELPGILWASRTTIKDATGHTPFSLVYGSEAVLPVEIGIPSTRVTYYSHDENEEGKRANLDLLPETRGNAMLRSIAQKQKIIRSFNRHVKTRRIQMGDLVLRKIEATGKIVEKGKLGAKWDGPFKVTRIIKPGTFELEDMKGKKLPRPWNGDHLKKFYI
ncbi:uncharacterized protein LOC130823331 [Amaranthus tricolor]|uniref:uncharacterized protein LOC130823331 n=1 Tax=Amaranthus tricolor TaxID=29722 RepID=UPI002584B3BB|nr:uncharacterized protein LOC130823331 [Amaranthus tricolor]